MRPRSRCCPFERIQDTCRQPASQKRQPQTAAEDQTHSQTNPVDITLPTDVVWTSHTDPAAQLDIVPPVDVPALASSWRRDFADLSAAREDSQGGEEMWRTRQKCREGEKTLDTDGCRRSLTARWSPSYQPSLQARRSKSETAATACPCLSKSAHRIVLVRCRSEAHVARRQLFRNLEQSPCPGMQPSADLGREGTPVPADRRSIADRTGRLSQTAQAEHGQAFATYRCHVEGYPAMDS